MLFKLHASSASDLKGPHNHCDGSLLEHSHQFILIFFFGVYFSIKTYFFHFTIPLLQNTHIKLSILLSFLQYHFYKIPTSNYQFFFKNILSQLSLLILILCQIFYLISLYSY